MATSIDFTNDYQVIDVWWYSGTQIGVNVVTDYWQRGLGHVSWYAERDIKNKLKSCRRLVSDTYGVWYVDAPDTITDEMLAQLVRMLVSGKTKTVAWED